MNLRDTISGIVLALAWARTVQADPIPLLKPEPIAPAGAILARQTITPGGAPCGEHGPTNRRCWKNNWNVSTDYEGVIPTGTTRTVSFSLGHLTEILSCCFDHCLLKDLAMDY